MTIREIIRIADDLLDISSQFPLEFFNEFTPIYKSLKIALLKLQDHIQINEKQISIIYHNRDNLNMISLLSYFQKFVEDTKMIKEDIKNIQCSIKIFLAKLKRHDSSKIVIEDFEKNSQKLLNEIVLTDKYYINHVKELFITLKDIFKKNNDLTLAGKFEIFIDKFYSINETIKGELDKILHLTTNIIFIFSSLCTYIICNNRNDFILCLEQSISELSNIN